MQLKTRSKTKQGSRADQLIHPRHTRTAPTARTTDYNDPNRQLQENLRKNQSLELIMSGMQVRLTQDIS